MDKVLFTCVGGTDPVKGLRDGGMLHIIRKYRPSKVYIILSAEVEKHHKADDRFNKAINKFSKDYNHKIEIKYISTGIEDVSDFDAFDELFLNEIKRISSENPESQILLNISSGSPQMKINIGMLSFNERFNTLAVQVKIPTRMSNQEGSTTEKKYDLETELELNEDNCENYEDRTSTPKLFLLKNAYLKEQIMSLIKVYNYEAAKLIIDYHKFIINDKTKKLIEHAIARQNLKTKKSEDIVRNIDIDFDLFPVKYNYCSTLTEYFLILKNYQETKKYTELVFRLNPFIIELQKEFLFKAFKFDFKKISECKQIIRGAKGERYLISRDKINNYDEKMLQFIDTKYSKYRDGQEANISILNTIIEYLDYENSLDKVGRYINTFKALGELNEYRNSIAHNLVGINEDDIKEGAHMSSQEIIKTLEQITCYIFENKCKTDIFEIYKKINAEIEKELR